MKIQKKKPLVHVFNGDAYFNVLPLTKVIAKYSREAHFFVIFISDPERVNQYTEHFKELAFKNYRLFYMRKGTIRFFEALKKAVVLLRYHGSTVVFHANFSISHIFVWIPVFERVVWYCWGYQHKQKAGFQGSFLPQLVMWSMRRYSKILCTMQGDADELTSVLGCRNCMVLPYPGEIVQYNGSPAESPEYPGRVKLLLGNNAHLIPNYIELLPVLAQLKSVASVTCMVAYGDGDGLKRKELDRLGKSLFGERYEVWDHVLPFDEYNRKMMAYDIYISSGKFQGGLCAIYTMLILGKKVFIAGRNLEWIKSQGFVVGDVEDLRDVSTDELIRPLSAEEQACNASRVQVLVGVQSQIQVWDEFFANL